MELLSRLSLLTGSGGLVFSGVEVVELGVVVLDLGFRAQGGRSELSWEATPAAKNSAAADRTASCFMLRRRAHILGLRCRFHGGCRRRR